MFPSHVVDITREVLGVESARGILAQAVEAGMLVSCLNPSHAATIAAMRERFGIEVPIPATAPQVALRVGDVLVVMSVRGLPRLDATRHEYSAEEIARATFAFAAYTVSLPRGVSFFTE